MKPVSLHQPLDAAQRAARRQAQRSLHVLRFVVAGAFFVVAGIFVQQGYQSWSAMAVASVVVGGESWYRIAHPGARHPLVSAIVDMTAIGVSCLVTGIAPMATAVPLAYAAATVVSAGGLHQRLAGVLVYGTGWSIVLAIAAASSEFRPESPNGTVIAWVAQMGFLLAVAVTVILHGRLTRSVDKYRTAAEEANDRKSAFLRNISHEIRTPMNGILGMADLLVESKLENDQLDQVTVIRSSGFELLGLINDLLDLSWIEAGEIGVETVPFAPLDALSTVFETYRGPAVDKGLDIEMYVSPRVPTTVMGDPGRFRQVVSVLASNAVKFTDDGAIWIRAGVMTSGAAETLRVSVTDTGIGMDDEQVRSIFGMFEQSDSSLTRRQGGSGIGLAIASRLAELMGGGLRVDSEPGFGSTFHLTIPLEPVELHNPVPRSDGESIKRVLFIRDEKASRDRFGAALLQAGFEVDEVSGPAQIDANRLAAADGVVFDVGADLAAVEHMRELHPVTSPILVITSGGQRGDSRLARQLGVAAYLSRPLGSDDVVSAVRTMTADDFDISTSPLITVHSLREARGRMRVLIADDSPTNRAIAALALRRRGYIITEVADGSQALSACQQEHFDFILMDIQMPVMDGLEATRRIRALEADTGTRVPIIAFTAHALRQDREAAEDAGVDAYLTKPLRVDAMIEAIEVNVPVAVDLAEPESVVPVGGATSVLDRSALVEQLGGDDAVVAEVVGLFRQTLPEHVTGLDAAVGSGDLDRVGRLAHRLKGELGALCAGDAHHSAGELETAALGEDWGGVERALRDLEADLKQLDVALDDVLLA